MEKVLRENRTGKRFPENILNVPGMSGNIFCFWTCVHTISGFSGKSYEKIVQKKDSGNGKNGVHGAREIIPFWTTWTKGTEIPESPLRKWYKKKIAEIARVLSNVSKM
jgi:hypothetical protein